MGLEQIPDDSGRKELPDCDDCNGTGKIDGEKCDTCDGSGKVEDG